MKSVKRKIVFLVRTRYYLEIHHKKPSDVTFVSDKKLEWTTRGFLTQVGEMNHNFLKDDCCMEMTVGVYDISDPVQALALREHSDKHLRFLLSKSIIDKLEELGIKMFEPTDHAVSEGLTPNYVHGELKRFIY